MARDSHVVTGVRVRFLTGMRTGYACEWQGPKFHCQAIARHQIAPEWPMPPTMMPRDALYLTEGQPDVRRIQQASYHQGWDDARSGPNAWYSVCSRHMAEACNALRDGRPLNSRNTKEACASCSHGYAEHEYNGWERCCAICEDGHPWSPR